jgi:hypothetical protein
MNKTPPSKEEQRKRNVQRMAKLTQLATLEMKETLRRVTDEEYDGETGRDIPKRKIGVSLHASNALLGAHLHAAWKSGDRGLCRLAIEGFMELVKPEMEKALNVANGEEAE